MGSIGRSLAGGRGDQRAVEGEAELDLVEVARVLADGPGYGALAQVERAAQALGLGPGGELAGAGQPALDEGEAVLLGVVDEGEGGAKAELERVATLRARGQ